LANYNTGKTGVEILANILKHCDSKTNRHIIGGLQKDLPDIARELRKRILTFDDLAYGDPRGIQKLIKLISIKDLAVSLKGASERVLKNLAENMSQRSLRDLREEISLIGRASEADAELARERIMLVVSDLIRNRELFINRPGDDLVY
jgi:flagellar motor switch protein FliG